MGYFWIPPPFNLFPVQRDLAWKINNTADGATAGIPIRACCDSLVDCEWLVKRLAFFFFEAVTGYGLARYQFRGEVGSVRLAGLGMFPGESPQRGSLII